MDDIRFCSCKAHAAFKDVARTNAMGLLASVSEEGGIYQKIDGAAHAVVAAVVAHHRAVVKETDEESLHQGDEVLHLRPQRGFLSVALQQADGQTARRAFTFEICLYVFVLFHNSGNHGWPDDRIHAHIVSRSCMYRSSPPPPSTSWSSFRMISFSNCTQKAEAEIKEKQETKGEMREPIKGGNKLCKHN